MTFDLVIVGSGFSAAFFLRKALSLGAVRSVAIVERGRRNDWEWQLENDRNAPPEDYFARHVMPSGLDGKTWQFNIGLGGGSNCWWANAMRFHPHDFDLASRYGVGADWPLRYDDLEAHYVEAERIMNIAGDPDSARMFPRSQPFAQPPHRFSAVARRFKAAQSDSFFAMPQARARVATEARNVCCSNSRCHLCPVNAKFSTINDMDADYRDPRVTVFTDHEVLEIVTRGNAVTGVAGRTRDGATFEISGTTVALAANGIFNPYILLRSGIGDGPVGEGLQEQYSVDVTVLLDGLDDGDGSSHTTGVGYGETHGDFRRSVAGCFFETKNLDGLRPHPTRFRQQVNMTFLFDDLRDGRNRVEYVAGSDRPTVHFEGFSDYAVAGGRRLIERLPDILRPLPVEDVLIDDVSIPNHAHIQGTTVMGTDPAQSVVDAGLVHHRLRNLLVLGSGAFPTAGWANPTLTICAMSLRAAARYYGT